MQTTELDASKPRTAGIPRGSESPSPILGVGDKIGSGDTYIVENLLADDLVDTAFERLKREVHWHTMFHRGGEVPRLVAVEGAIENDGNIPIYRHPADESPPLHPFTPTVSLIAQAVSKVVNHPANHVLIQHYRSGNDYISEHSDKTIDVVRGSSIVNVSIGAQRVMFLRRKKDLSPTRYAQRIPLPHNSVFVMGLNTNREWLHGIHRDNRPVKTKSDVETAFGGERISLTFRHIGTYLTSDSSLIYGQGAVGKTREEARLAINGIPEEFQKLIDAFGKENHESLFDWDEAYGQGFDVVNYTV
ncbi:hypothetical protein EDD18DRAFT_1307503 [Armillaria luteobubalina]|uniref:Fe2OG dioxygenase domain-containing protein n=1 Tax=Armillaria luteobubalina TaxID=153913 RepID=A0AA39QDT9_9AGAR|nr:hypothetical protein EDD18DRAFT_1307503 [Armillaria luteobubalina]